MKYEVHITMEGPSGVVESTHTGPPMEADSIQELLTLVKLPDLSHLGVEIVGFRVKKSKEQSA